MAFQKIRKWLVSLRKRSTRPRYASGGFTGLGDVSCGLDREEPRQPRYPAGPYPGRNPFLPPVIVVCNEVRLSERAHGTIRDCMARHPPPHISS